MCPRCGSPNRIRISFLSRRIFAGFVLIAPADSNERVVRHLEHFSEMRASQPAHELHLDEASATGRRSPAAVSMGCWGPRPVADAAVLKEDGKEEGKKDGKKKDAKDKEQQKEREREEGKKKGLREPAPTKTGLLSFGWWGSDKGQAAGEGAPDGEEGRSGSTATDKPGGKVTEQSVSAGLGSDAASPEQPSPVHVRKRSWSFVPGPFIVGSRKVAPEPPPSTTTHKQSAAAAAKGDDAHGLFRISAASVVTDGDEAHSHADVALEGDSGRRDGRPWPHAIPREAAQKQPPRAKQPQGYRRLWQSISSVRKGDGVPGTLPHGPDVTVEGLFRAVQVRWGYVICPTVTASPTPYSSLVGQGNGFCCSASSG